MNIQSALPELPAIGFPSDVDESRRAFLASFASPVDGRNLCVAVLGAGASIGEIDRFDPAAASASVITRSECLIWRIASAELEGVFEADPAAMNVALAEASDLGKVVEHLSARV